MLCLAVASCGGSDDPPPASADGREPRRTTSSTTDPWAVPDPITVEYVERVLAEIEKVIQEVSIDVRESGQLTQAHKDKLRTVVEGPQYDAAVESLKTAIDERFVNSPERRGARRYLYLARPRVLAGCLGLIGTIDQSEVMRNAPEPFRVAIELAMTPENKKDLPFRLSSLSPVREEKPPCAD